MYKKWLQRIHKYLGIIALIFLIVISITGAFLIFSDYFSLNDSIVESSFLLSLIGETQSLSWKSYILSLHKGYYFGYHIPFLQFAIALSLFILSLSGILLYIRKLQGKKKALGGSARHRILKELKAINQVIDTNENSKESLTTIKSKVENMASLLEENQ